jgi:hypothetical protein
MITSLPQSHAYPSTPGAPPTELEALAPPPLLLPGESLHRYELMRRAILIELAPRSVIEWLLAIDVVELCWEIQRYRLVRQKLLENHRQRAIEHCLRQIDLAGIPADLKDDACQQIKRNAATWRTDSDAAIEVEGRLSTYGFDQNSINAEAYHQAGQIFLTFEALIASAQNRRTGLLRELDRQRYCGPP